ncbi:MAG: hypothetical protein RBG13Loki_3373 [Promethearchaeota archaeon CR_4]|nr:MAG: hypothetical protein RBG13Loki_3373 [Candidatus Lokiarchaeota archaeon CR_4]
MSTSFPLAIPILRQRSPKGPHENTIPFSLSPSKLRMQASIAPEPEDVKIRMSFFVNMIFFIPSLMLAIKSSINLERWVSLDFAISLSTRSGTHTGPGVKSFNLDPSTSIFSGM